MRVASVYPWGSDASSSSTLFDDRQEVNSILFIFFKCFVRFAKLIVYIYIRIHSYIPCISTKILSGIERL